MCNVNRYQIKFLNGIYPELQQAIHDAILAGILKSRYLNGKLLSDYIHEHRNLYPRLGNRNSQYINWVMYHYAVHAKKWELRTARKGHGGRIFTMPEHFIEDVITGVALV